MPAVLRFVFLEAFFARSRKLKQVEPGTSHSPSVSVYKFVRCVCSFVVLSKDRVTSVYRHR